MIAQDARPDDRRLSGPRVLVTRAAGQSDELASALRDAGLDPVTVPAIAVEIDPSRGDLDRAAAQLHSYCWVVITSANGARAILKAAERVLTELGAPGWAAIGPATRTVLEREGIEVQFQPGKSAGVMLAAELPVRAGDRILLLRGDLADRGLAETLRSRGVEVDDVIAYRTLEAPESSRPLLRRAVEDGPLDAVVFTSGSTVRGLLALGHAEGLALTAIPAVCIGPGTKQEATRGGFHVIAVSASPRAIDVAAAVAAARIRQPGETA